MLYLQFISLYNSVFTRDVSKIASVCIYIPPSNARYIHYAIVYLLYVAINTYDDNYT